MGKFAGAHRAAALSLCALALFGLTACGAGAAETTAPTAAAVQTTAAQTEATETTRAPERKQDLETVLILGLDKNEYPQDERAYLNDMQADLDLVLVIDRDKKVCTPLLLNRDTMTKITRLGVFGDAADSFTGQLALAHTYGSGGSDSCLNSKRAVQDLLGEDIDHYMSFTMESVPAVNDAVGGVAVTVLEDFGENYPQLKKGEEVLLTGENALVYVRGRQNVGDQTNTGRMERQEQYMSALIEKLRSCAKENPDFLTNLTLKLGDAFQTDYTVSQLQALSELLLDCQIEPFVTLTGETRKGEEFMEFYVDEVALVQTVQDIFYQ